MSGGYRRVHDTPQKPNTVSKEARSRPQRRFTRRFLRERVPHVYITRRDVTLGPLGGLFTAVIHDIHTLRAGASGHSQAPCQSHNIYAIAIFLDHLRFSVHNLLLCAVHILYSMLNKIVTLKFMKPHSNGLFWTQLPMAKTHKTREGSSPRPSVATRHTFPRAARCLDMTSRRDHAEQPRGTRAKSLGRPVRAHR